MDSEQAYSMGREDGQRGTDQSAGIPDDCWNSYASGVRQGVAEAISNYIDGLDA